MSKEGFLSELDTIFFQYAGSRFQMYATSSVSH